MKSELYSSVDEREAQVISQYLNLTILLKSVHTAAADFSMIVG